MTRDEFAEQVMAQRNTLYYISLSMLHNRADQEDAVSESVRKALQKLDTLRDDRLFKTWLTRILINECHNIMRRRKREIPIDDVLPVNLPPVADVGAFDVINQLDEKYRLPILLHYWEGYTTKEIAGILRVPDGTIKARLVKGRALLKTLIGEEVLV